MYYAKLMVLLLLLTACGQQEQAEQAKPTVFKPTGDVMHLMAWVLDPAADHVWDSAGSIITATGTRELAPTTDEGWLAVQHSAAVIAETGNLLLMPGLIRDNGDWQDISHGLIAAGMRAKAAAEAQDTDALFDAGGQIYRVCTSCHSLYIHGDDESPEQL